MTRVKIDRLGHHGDGIATTEAGPVFVPFALPGETVEGDITADRMVAARILVPSDDRVKAPCPHFKSCGGCALQHASDEFLANWKLDIMRAALSAHQFSTEFRTPKVSPPQSRRRATLSGRKTKKAALVGFHGRASNTVIAIPDCKLLHPDIMAGLPALESLTRFGASRKGELSLAVTQSAAGLDVSVTYAKEADGPMLAQLGQMVGQLNLARLSWNGEIIATRSAPVQTFGANEVIPPPGAFLQATETGQIALIGSVKEIVGTASKVVDLFAGCGTFSLPIARNAEVHALESSAPQLAALDTAWRKAKGLKTVTTETRDLFRRPLLAAELNQFGAVIIDPPRAGAVAQTAELANSQVPQIAYVSCNPATFARDAAVLCENGYRLDWVQVVDQFRWSPHVELAAQFTKSG